jgi:hypothetical protein
LHSKFNHRAVSQEAYLQRKVTYLWKEPGVPKGYRSAVSLHGHTNHSKESLFFIAEYAARHTVLRRALSAQERRAKAKAGIAVDFWKGYWTPPLPPLTAYQIERQQVENTLGLNALISLTDHDSIEAPMLLRVVPEARRVPVSLEWSIPFKDSILHLGIHNLPSSRAESITAQLNEFTEDPDEKYLPGLMRMLNEYPDVLVVFNHPLWDLAGIGRVRHTQAVSNFLAEQGMFVHALEINGLRSLEENLFVGHLAEGWNLPVVSGGDRHGYEPSAVLNLTETENFAEFIHQVRKDGDSHILYMPQYQEPVALRVMQTLLDVIRVYPDYSIGSQRWDERVFHPDQNGVPRPLSSLWKKSPSFIEAIFSCIRLVEMTPVRRAMQFALAGSERQKQMVFGGRQEVTP